MKHELRLILVLLALLLPAALFLRWGGGGNASVEFRLGELDQAVGSYQSLGDDALEADVLAQIQPDRYVNRVYATPEHEALYAYVAFYRGGADVGAHDPAVCYPAQGWEVAQARDVVLTVGGESMDTRVLVVTRDGRKELVLYWFQPAHRLPRSRMEEQLLRVVDALRGAPQYAFVRLSTTLDSEEDSLEQLSGFASAFAPRIGRILLGEGTPDSGLQLADGRAR